jgi:NADH-quinone oxidoreductase subunit M
MPVFSALFMICMLSSVGLPGLNGFIGEVLCIFGVFKVSKLAAIFAVLTVILAAGYLLWLFQRVMQGPITNEKILSFKDVNKREIAYLIPIVIMMFWMGIYPKPFLRKMDASVTHLLDRVHKREAIFTKAQEGKDIPLKIEASETKKTDKEDIKEKERPTR